MYILQHKQYLILYCLRNLNPAYLKAMYPGIDFVYTHCVEYLSELFYLVVGIFLLPLALVFVQFLIVEIKVVGTVAFFAVSVTAAAYAIFTVVSVVFFCRFLIAVKLAQ